MRCRRAPGRSRAPRRCGAGFARPRRSRHPSPSSAALNRTWPSGRARGVAQDAEAGDLDLDGVAGHDLTDAGRRAGEDDVAGKEGEGGRRVLDDLGEREDHVADRALLAHFAVEAGRDDGVALDVELRLDRGAERARGVEALRAGPLPVGALPVPGGEVVAYRVAEDVVEGVLSRDVLRDAADDSGELALEADEVRVA